MAAKAAEITPDRMSARLDVANAPAELQSLAESFNAMLDRLATGYERLLQFSADLAHEVRTPIGVLIGQTQVTLAHTRSAAEYRSVLESNLEELERLGRIAQNILFLAQADHEAQQIERTRLVIREELETIRTYFEGIADERQITSKLPPKAKWLHMQSCAGARSAMSSSTRCVMRRRARSCACRAARTRKARVSSSAIKASRSRPTCWRASSTASIAAMRRAANSRNRADSGSRSCRPSCACTAAMRRLRARATGG